MMKRITLAERPIGAPEEKNFRLEEIKIPEPKNGEVLIEIHYMSLDPYMRGRMDDGKSYAKPVEIGEIMEGGAVGLVIASKSKIFNVNDHVFGQLGWATHACAKDTELRKLDPTLAPITTSLGVLGMPGFTGWYGLTQLGRPKKGETLVVGAATGPVGSMVGQIAKSKGLRTIGVAGGAEKCALAKEKFGFDHCIDHKAFADGREMKGFLQEVCPNGIDIYFENVAGKTLDAILPLMNRFGRIPVCGMVSWYNLVNSGARTEGTMDKLPKMWRSILIKHLSVTGFIISNHWDLYKQFLREVGPMLSSGDIAYQEHIIHGIENAPSAFAGLLEGQNLGKLIVKVN